MEHTTNENDSIARVPTDRLTDFELKHVVDRCDWVRIGYDSSHSDSDVTTRRVVDPTYDHSVKSVRTPIAGKTPDGDGRVGFSRHTVKTAASNGRIGQLVWVEYPAPEPDKTRWNVTFRALAGKLGSRMFEGVEDRTEHVVEHYSRHGVEFPKEREMRQREVDLGEDKTTIKVAVDIQVSLIVCDDDTTDDDEVVERARQKFTREIRHSNLRSAEWVRDIPAIGDHVVEYGTSMGLPKKKNLRKAVNYWLLHAEIESTAVGD